MRMAAVRPVRRHVAFLRAINVGGHTVRMEDLRRIFEGLRLADVETFIASGNVIFAGAGASLRALEKRIEARLHAELGYPVSTFLRSCAEVGEIARYEPFSASELRAAGNTVYVAFAAAEPDTAARRRLKASSNPVDAFHVHGREVYWLRRRDVGESRYSGALLEKAVGAPVTVRNVSTVRKLAAKYPA